jgi:hypothetical protein
MAAKRQHFLRLERPYSPSLQPIIENESIDIDADTFSARISIDDTFKVGVGIDIEYRRYF